MARVYRGHPFVVVPDVVTALCGERVLVSEYVDGARFASVLDAPQAERDRLGEILIRFYLNGPLRHRLLNGDPHPGNALFLPDGRVGVRRLRLLQAPDRRRRRPARRDDPATYEGDAQKLLDVVVGLGSLPPDPALAEPFLESYRAIFGWLLVDHPTTVDAANTAAMMRRYTELRRADGFDGLTLPAEHFVLMRAVFLLIGLLGQLRANGTWFDLAREWLFGDEPTTELGRLEAEFFSRSTLRGMTLNPLRRAVVEDLLTQTGRHDEPHVFGGRARRPGADRPGQHVVGDQRRHRLGRARRHRRDRHGDPAPVGHGRRAGPLELPGGPAPPRAHDVRLRRDDDVRQHDGRDAAHQRGQADARQGRRRAARRRPLPRARPRADRLGAHLHPVGGHDRLSTATTGR